MKDPYQILFQKEGNIVRVQREIAALHFVIPLLAEEADWVENGLAVPLCVARVREAGTAA